MTAEKLVLIDLSSIARPIYETQIDPQRTSVEIVAKVRALASAHAHVAIACDSRTSFRRDIDPTYKAQRPETPAVYLHELGLAVETLRGDGFPVWAAEGFEADDIIATAVSYPRTMDSEEPYPSLIVSADKDLFQLVNTRVEQFRPANGSTVAKTFDADAVFLRYGVHPHQILDYLALVGDTSDNIKGADGIGEKKAAAMLQKFGNLDDIMAAVEAGDGLKFTPSTLKSLHEFKPRMELVRSLLRLRTDAPIPFEEILKPRVPVDVATFGDDEPQDDIEFAMPTLDESGSVDGDTLGTTGPSKPVDSPMGELPIQADAAKSSGETTASKDERNSPKAGMGSTPIHSQPNNGSGLVLYRTEPTVVDWQRELEPRDMAQAKELSTAMFASRLFSAYGHPAGIMATVLAGREIGMQAMTSLRAFHIIDGKPTLSAGAIHAMVLKSGQAEYFRCSERTPERCTFITKRKGEPEQSLTFTIEDARQAWAKDDVAWKKSGYGRNPADQLVARASTKLARLVYPDVIHNLYASEEMEGA